MKHPDYYAYPAIFTTDGDGWEAAFPDLDNCFTAADTLEQAIVEAKYVLEDAMYFRERDNDDIPAPTPLAKIKAKPGDVVQLVVAVMPETRRGHSRKAVKKTLTIPAWMEDELKKNPTVNVSMLLQNAIKRELNLPV
jgi:predicted RNase H-like HicB family nuclease